jgi:two-component system chemotaxis sensor kinase CheA
MNEFLEQFLIESRELVEQGTADLLALEKAPADAAHLDSAFRAFHTLKGGAGIVDFTAMAQAVHAAEDALAGVRSGASAISATLIGDCLTCLDRVVQWLDAIERTGELPKDAAAEADSVVAQVARSAAERGGVAPSPRRDAAQTVDMPQAGGARQVGGAAHAGGETQAGNVGPAGDWLGGLSRRFADVGARARTAVRYTPDRNCFYSGEDPCARVAALPGLLAVNLEPVAEWPPLDALDPFACALVLTALCESAPADVANALAGASGRCEVLGVGDPLSSEGDPRALSAAARDLLEAQRALLGIEGASGRTGRIASAGAVAANVLRHARRSADADRVAQAARDSVDASDPRALRDALAALLTATAAAAQAPPAPPPVVPERDSGARTLRIDASRIDALVDLTGELIVAKNAIGHAALLANQGDAALAAILKQRFATLDQLLGALQRSVLSLRVLPLRHVFQRFPRLVREISADLGKPTELVIEGGETEADKAIVEMLFEPLVHVLRNAIDHGVERADVRAARGKPATATVRLAASRHADNVVIEVADDGQGIDAARVRQAAAERKLLSDDALAGLSDDEAIQLVFEPGFSTAGAVTGLSGRGVGMDAVRHAVGRFGGAVTLESRPGLGTTVRFTLPFSVMMTTVVQVGAGDRFFGIPLDVIVETVLVDADAIVPVGGAQALVYRNRTIPLVDLAASLGLPLAERRESKAMVVVTRVDGQYGALRVDRIGERMEIMLKPLEGLLAGAPGLAGSTLLGDGSVLLVLDVGELLQ